MDRPINGGKNLAQGFMQMEARPVTSGVNMRTVDQWDEGRTLQQDQPQPVNM